MSQFAFSPNQQQQLQTEQITGTILYVGSTVTGAANSAGRGYSPGTAFLTLAYALTQVATIIAQGAAVGIPNVTIVVLAGHTESIAAAGGITAVANVRVVGQGTGTNRPTFTFTTSAAATFLVGAANFTIDNCRFTTTIDELVTGFSVTGVGFQVTNCEFIGTASAQFIACITTTATATDFVIANNRFEQATAAAANGRVISLVGGDYGVIANNFFAWVTTNNAASNMIGSATTAAVGLEIRDNTFYHTGGVNVVTVSLVANSTGMFIRNNAYSTKTSQVGTFAIANLASSQSFATNAVNTNGVLDPAADT